ERNETWESLLMYQRGRDWTGGVACAVALALVGWALQGPGAAWAAAERAQEGGLTSLDRSLIVQVVNFVILLVILQRLLYKPFLAKMQERTGAIQKSLEEAQAARAEVARQQEENEARLRAAYAEAAAVRDAALKEAAEESRKHIAAAQAQARKMVEDTKSQLDAEVRRAREELRREVSDLAVAVAEQLVPK